MHERTKKAFDFYADATKQLITLSTGIIALVITFGRESLYKLSPIAKTPLMLALVLYLISIWFGLHTLLGLTGTLQPYQKSTPEIQPLVKPAQEEPSIYEREVIKPSKLQIILFLAATSMIVIAGLVLAFKPPT